MSAPTILDSISMFRISRKNSNCFLRKPPTRASVSAVLSSRRFWKRDLPSAYLVSGVILPKSKLAVVFFCFCFASLDTPGLGLSLWGL